MSKSNTYVIKNQDGQFFTGNLYAKNGKYPLQWSRNAKDAKRYSKYRWAEKAAEKWGGSVEIINDRI